MEDWHPADVQAAIRKTGISMSELSRRAGRHETIVRQALTHKMPHVQAIIAAHLGIPPQQIWPSRYLPDGSPLRKRRGRPPKPNTSTEVLPKRQNGDAA